MDKGMVGHMEKGMVGHVDGHVAGLVERRRPSLRKEAGPVTVVSQVGRLVMDVGGDSFSFVQAVKEARAGRRLVSGITGPEGELTCRHGHAAAWVLVRQVASRLDFECKASVVLRGRDGPCLLPGTAYLDKRKGFGVSQGQGAAYGTLRAVVVVLGQRPGLTARQVALIAGLRAGQVEGCLARLLRRELVLATPGVTIPSGHKTMLYSLSEAGQAYYAYYQRGVAA